MNCYVVIVPEDSALDPSKVQETFPDSYTIVEKRVWVIAHEGTSADIVEKLGIGDTDKDSDPSGVVFGVEDYDGYMHRGLWRKLQAWNERHG